MNRRWKPSVFALVTFCSLAVAASVVVAFIASEVYNIGAPAQTVGPNTQNVLAMDIFMADNTVMDSKLLPGERPSGLGDAIEYFDRTNGFAGYVNFGLAAGDMGTAFPANTVYANRGGAAADDVPTGADHSNVADEMWEDANTNGFFDTGETEVWWEGSTAPLDGVLGLDLRVWASGAYGPFVWANDEIYYWNGPGMDVNKPMWVDRNEDGPAGEFEHEPVIYPEGGGGFAFDGTPAAGPTFGASAPREVWADGPYPADNSPGAFSPADDHVWDDTNANNLFDNEPLIFVLAPPPTTGDPGVDFAVAYANPILIEDEDLDGMWDPGEDLFEDVIVNGQYDAGEPLLPTGGPPWMGNGAIAIGAPGVPLPAGWMFIDGVGGVANVFDPPNDDLFIDTNGSGAWEQEPMLVGGLLPDGTPGTLFDSNWSFSAGYVLIWDDTDANTQYDADLVVFGAPKAHPSDPDPLQPLLYNGDEEIFVDNIPASIGFTGKLSVDPDEFLNVGQGGVTAAHGADLTWFTYDPEGDGVERFADIDPPAGYNDTETGAGDEIFEDHDNSMTYTLSADDFVLGDDGDAGPRPSRGDVLTPPGPGVGTSFLDLNFDDVLSDNEPVFDEGVTPNQTMDVGETPMANWSGGPMATFSGNFYFIDTNGNGLYSTGEPIIDNLNFGHATDGDPLTFGDMLAEIGEPVVRSSGPDQLIPFGADEFFVDPSPSPSGYFNGDDIFWSHRVGTSGAPEDAQYVFDFFGPDGIPGAGGDDLLYQSFDMHGTYQPTEDNIHIDRDNNRQYDIGAEIPGLIPTGVDQDLGETIRPLTVFNWKYDDLSAGLWWGPNEPSYIDVDNNNIVTAGDLRVYYAMPGYEVNIFDPDHLAPTRYFLSTPGTSAEAIYYGPGPYWVLNQPLIGYPAYWTNDPSGFQFQSVIGDPPQLVSCETADPFLVVRLNEVRVADGAGNIAVYPALSLVHEGDWDLNPTLFLPANWSWFSAPGTIGAAMYIDSNGSTTFNPGELVYCDEENGGGLEPNLVHGSGADPDDRIYSYYPGWPSGAVVGATDFDIGRPLTQSNAAPDEIAVKDGWGGTPGQYDPGEQIYYRFPNGFAGYTPGTPANDGFPVQPGDYRVTYRPDEVMVAQGFAGNPARANDWLAPFSEEFIPNGVLDGPYDEANLNEPDFGYDLNHDGDALDTGLNIDLNASGSSVLNQEGEDRNLDHNLNNPQYFWASATPLASPLHTVANTDFFFGGTPANGFYAPNHHIMLLMRDGGIATPAPGSRMSHNWGTSKHFDDGGRGYGLAGQFWWFDGTSGNGVFDDGEAIVGDDDDDNRWDVGEDIETDSGIFLDPAVSAPQPLPAAETAVLALNSFTSPTFVFADVSGGVANGLFDDNEAIIADFNNNLRWENGEPCILNSEFDHLNLFTIEKHWDGGANDWVLDWDDGGTYSDGPDTPRDIVDGVIDTPEGFALTTFPSHVGYHNVLASDEYRDYENDEIFGDLDGDGKVTIFADDLIYAPGAPVAQNGDDLNRFLPVPPFTDEDNKFVGWVDDDASTTYDGDAGDEEDIFADLDGDGVVDELDDVMTEFALTNPLSANEPTDVVAVNLWMEDGATAGFQPTEDMLIGLGTVDPMDNRHWTWTGLAVPLLSEDRNGDGDDDDTLDETTDFIDYNGDGDLLDNNVQEWLLVNGIQQAAEQGRGELDSQTRLYATIDISADPQNLLIGNQFDATIPINAVSTVALNMGPTDMEIHNSSAGGAITIDDYPPTVVRVEEIWLNDYTLGAMNVRMPGDNEYEVGGDVDLVFRTPSDNDVRRLKVMYALDEAGPWMNFDLDPNADVGGDGEPGVAGIDDDGDWDINTDDVGQDGLPLTGDPGEGNGVPDAGEPGVDQLDPEVLAALTNPLNDGLDNNDDGYIDDFEYEPAGMDVDRDGLVGEGFPEADQTNGVDDDLDGVIDDDGVDVDGNGVFGEPDPNVDPVTFAGGDSDYLGTHASLYMYDNDENGIADRDEFEHMAMLVNDNFWLIPDSTMIPPAGGPLTMWRFRFDSKLMQYVLNGSPALPEYDRIYVKGVAFDLFGSVIPLYSAPTVLWLDNLAPEVVVYMTDSQGAPVNDGDIVYDNETYNVGVTSSDTELLNIEIKWGKNDDAGFLNQLGIIQEVDETLPWTPDPVGNAPPDQSDDYYWEATASDILQWYSVTSQQWQPYLDGSPPNNFFGNAELSALPEVCNPAIVLSCLTAADAAELHVEAVNATAPLSAITRMYTETRMGYDEFTSPYWFTSLGDFVDGVRVPAYNAVLIFVDNEDLNEDGLLNDGDALPGHGALLDEAADAFDYNRDGDMLDMVNEDMNDNDILDDGIDDMDGDFRTSDIVGCVFEQTLAGENNWVPIATLTGDTVGGVVQDLSFPVAVTWDTRTLAASEVTYYVRVRCWDVEGNWLDEGIEIVTVTVDATGLNAYFNQDPTEVTSPAIDGAVVNDVINLYAYSVDPVVTQVLFRYSDDGGITWYEIGTDTSPDSPGDPAPPPPGSPCGGPDPTCFRDWYMSFDTSNHPDGDYLFDVVGLDEFGNSDDDPADLGQQMTLTFDNTAPILAITSPAAGTFVSANNGNMILDLVAEAQTVENGPVSAQFQYSTDGGTSWNDIDGINSEVGTATLLAGDYFGDNPRKGLRMGAYNMHPQDAAVTTDWLQDMIYRKAVGNTDHTMVEVGDYRETGCPWTDPMYAADTWVAKGDQDVGTPLIPMLAPYDSGDAMSPSADSFGPYTATFVTNAVLAQALGAEMASDMVVLLRCVGTDAFGMTDATLAPTVEITIRDNADPLVDLIEVTDASGGMVVDSDAFADPNIVLTDQFPGGITFDNTLRIFTRAADNTPVYTDQQGTIANCQVWYRPRQVDYNYTGVIDWMPGPIDDTYPFTFDMDISGMNGLYEFTIVGTDESGNTSGAYPQFSLVIQNQEATVTGLPATVNEGVTVTLNADYTAPPIDGDLPLTANFWVAPVVVGEAVAPSFQNAGAYAGYYTAMLEGDIVNDVDPAAYPDPSGPRNFVTLDGRDVVVDVGGTPGVYHPFADLAALASPTCYDFAIDYGTNEIIFAIDPSSCGDATVDYHVGSWLPVGIGDDAAPFSVEWTPGFSEGGDYDVICTLAGTEGGESPTSGAFARTVALSSDPGDNVEPAFAEWSVITVADTQAPLFTVGGLGRLSTDDMAFMPRWNVGSINLGNAVNNMDGGPETMLSGNEVDLLVQQTGEVLDPTSVAWAIRDGNGVTVDSDSFEDVGGFFGVPREHPITFTLFEADFAQVVQGADFENVELWLDVNDDNNFDTDMAERNAEIFAMTDMGDYWQTTVTFDSSVLPEYMFLVDTFGDDLDFDGDGFEDPVDDPRNQWPPSMGGDGYEIDQNNGGEPSDSYLRMPDYVSFWANVDISGLPDGVYFFDITADDMSGNSSTVSKRVVLDRTPFPQDHIAVTTANDVGMPGSTVTLFAHITDPLTGDVNVNDALQVTFQYFDGVDWMWCNGGGSNTSAFAIDTNPADGWSIDWTVPDPSSDLKDNDGDGFVDEADEGEFTVQVRAVVRDLAFNLAYQSPGTNFTIDSIAPLTYVALAEVEGDGGTPTPAEGKVVTLGEWVDLYAPVPTNETAEAVVFQYSVNANAGSSPAMPDAATIWPGTEITRPAGLQKGDDIGYVGDPVLMTMGGPDAFGYTWFDSKGGGATYDWVEITGVGTLAGDVDDDDDTDGPYPIGFSFPFYGDNYTEFWICSNGWITFDTNAADSEAYTNICLPSDEAPESGYTGTMVAAFWDDLDPDYHPVDDQRIWYHNDGTRLIVQYDEMPDHHDPYDPYTFELILYPDGRIVMQYQTLMPGIVNSSTVGIQDITGTMGLNATCNAPYLQDGLAIQFNPPGAAMWVDIDATPDDTDDDYTTGAGVVHETPDFVADDNVGGTDYYKVRFNTEVIRAIMMGSGDLFAEVRALGVDPFGNEGTTGSTILVINDMQAPVVAVTRFNVPGIGWRYANDPTLAIGGENVTVRTYAIGFDESDVATVTLQVSMTGGTDPAEWSNVGTAGVDAFGMADFVMDVSGYPDGMIYLRAYAADEDGNITGDEDGDGAIDSDEAAKLNVAAVLVDNGMPAMAIWKFGYAGFRPYNPVTVQDGDVIMPDDLPRETQFQPVLPQNITVMAGDLDDGSVDVFSCDLQFFDDATDPANPAWLTIADMEYRDDPGDRSPEGLPPDGHWLLQFASMSALQTAMETAAGGELGSREYRFRALATSYSGMTNHAEVGTLLMYDPFAPSITDIAVGDEDLEGGGGGWTVDIPVQVAGGDAVSIWGYIPDSWDDLIPGADGVVEPGIAWESSGIYGVRARVRTANGPWQTVGLMALDSGANLPATYYIEWETPLNVAWSDSLLDIELSARDEAGNYSAAVRDGAINVQDHTPPDGTEITNIYATPGAVGSVFPNPVTETTIRLEGTWVSGTVTLVAQTAAGDASIDSTASVFFEVSPDDGATWILLNAGAVGDSIIAPIDGAQMAADDQGGVHLGMFWNVVWNTLAVDGDGNLITPDGLYLARAWCIDAWGNHELLDDVFTIEVTVDNTAPIAVMDANWQTEERETGYPDPWEVERNDVYTAFARTMMPNLVTEDTSEDATLEFMIKLSTDMNVATSWSRLGPGYDATDVNPDATRPYSFDWWTNRNTPPLEVGADYDIAVCAWDRLGNTATEVAARDSLRHIRIRIVDRQAPLATITRLVRSIGDPTVITFPDEVCVVGIDSLEATILGGDSDTKFVQFYYRPEGTTEWILADGDVAQMGDLTWALYNWDVTLLAPQNGSARIEVLAQAEDDAGNAASLDELASTAITLIVNNAEPVFAAVSPESDAIPVWEPSLSAATASYSSPGTPVVISPEGPQPWPDGRVAPTGSYSGTDFRTYTITITSNGNSGSATFNWSATGQGGSGTGLLTGPMVALEDGIMVSFCDGTDTPSFQTDDVFTFHTAGKTVDLVVTTDVGMDDIDPNRVFFEYKRSDMPDIDANWMRDAIAPCGVLHDDMLNTWSSKWDISGLESCLYDVRLTMWDVCGNWRTEDVALNVIVDNTCPNVAITNIENADENDTTLEPIDFGQITDITRGVPVEIWATANDDEPCLPESHETAVKQFQFQLGSTLTGGGQADIVWVIDGSGSMDVYQTAIAQNAQTMAGALAGLDVQYGVVWFATSSGPINTNGSNGTPSAGTGQFTTSAATFGTMVQAVGTSRGDTEYGLNALVASLQHYTFRPGASVFLVLVGDENVQGMNLAAALPQLQAANVTVYSIINPSANPIADYQNAALQTGGQWFNIASDFGQSLAVIGQQIAAITGGGWQDLGLYEVPVGTDDDPEDADVAGSTLWDTSGLTEGEYFLRVLAYDEADNVCYSGIVQVNVIDDTPPVARVAGFDPDVLHGDDENTLERVYAMVYSDDEIVDVQLQYWSPDRDRWVTFGVASQVAAGSYDPLEIHNIPEVWAADFNLSDLVDPVLETGFEVGSQIIFRAVAKDSDSRRGADDGSSSPYCPELTATIMTNPVDGSLMLCPSGPVDMFDPDYPMEMSSPRNDNVLLAVRTTEVEEVPRVLVVYEDIAGADNAMVLPMTRTIEVGSATFQGNVDMTSVMPGGEISMFATAVQLDGTPTVQMLTKSAIVHPVDDALGSNGVASVPYGAGCETAGPMGASVEVPPGSGQSGGLYIGPAGMDVPMVPESQAYYIDRFGQAYYIELFGAGDFNDGYAATVTIAYDDTQLPEGTDESMLVPRYWGSTEDGYMWRADGISHVDVNTTDNEVTFVVDNLGSKNFWSLFTRTSAAPIAVQDFIPWSQSYTDHDPVIKIMLDDIYDVGVDPNTIEIYIGTEVDDEIVWREVANTGPNPDWVLGNGSLVVRQVSADGTRWEVQYNHSTIGDPQHQNEKGGDLLDGGMHHLLVKFENYNDQVFALDEAAPLAAFGVDVTPVRYWWNPDPEGIGTNFVLGRDPVIEVRLWDLDAGIHIQDVYVGNQGTGRLRDGIKMDIYRVNTDDDEPGGTGDSYYSRNFIQTATPDMLVFDPPIDEYDPAVHDTLIVQYPMYQANLDAYNGQELEVVIYTQRTTEHDPDFEDYEINRYDLAVMDNVGNVGSPFVSHRYRIDVCGPTVDFITPECGSVVEPDEDLLVRADISDVCDIGDNDDAGRDIVFEGSGIDVSSIVIEVMSPADTLVTAREPEITSERITFTLPAPLQLGEYTLTFWVSDVLGNTTRAECSFTVGTDDRLIADAYVYPNPFDPANGGGAFVVNAGQEGARATIKVYDFAGDFVATVAHDVKVGWGTEIPWDGRAEDGTMLASGPYIAHVRVANGDGAMTRVVKVMVWQLDN